MMKSNDHFLQSVCVLAIPVALQSMLQSAFSMVDQIMIGQLGEIQVAGVGLAGKFASIYAVLISAIGAAAGIMISQYLGQENDRGVRQSFFCKSAAERRHCRYIYRGLYSVPRTDHGRIHAGCADPPDRSGISGVDLRYVHSHGRSGTALHAAALPGKAPAAVVCQYCGGAVEYGAELHSDLRKARACAHGYKGRGQTKYVMFIDGIGTWCCGVPLGLLSAFVLRLPVAWVYFLLSLEECLRFGFSMAVFRRKKWMRRLDAGAQPSGLP